MLLFFCLISFLLGLHAKTNDELPSNSESKVTMCHLPQQNDTLYKMSSINADFAFNLYRKFAVEIPDQNIFFSPVSISVALAMLSFGAASNTQTQILEVLGFNFTDTSIAEIQQDFQQLICSLNFPKKELELQMGNILFIDKHLKALSKFLDAAKTLYETEIFSTDFKNASAAQEAINCEVNKQTKGKIVNLIQDLKLNTIMVLVNYIHFKAQWANPFHPSKTEDSSSFLVDKTITVKVPMMHQTEQFHYLVDTELNCTVLQMDYNKNALALFVLPEKGEMERVESSMSSKTLKKWNRLLQKGLVNIFVPKFSISVTYDLRIMLMKMGIEDAFADNADFSGLTEDSGVKLSYAAHKVVLSIDEKGTDDLTVSEEVKSLGQSESTPLHPIIRFDRTFLLIILEKNTRSILFLGKVVDPTEV